MSGPPLTKEEELFPVHCPKCRVQIPKTLSDAQTYCDSCLAEIASKTYGGASATAQNPASNPSMMMPASRPSAPVQSRGPASWKLAVAICASLFVVLIGAGALALYNARKASATEQLKISATIASLSLTHPEMKFAAVTTLPTTVGLDANFETLRVVSVRLERFGADVKAKGRMYGLMEKPVAPEVNVTLFDENGKQLGEGDVVRHLFKDLLPSDYKETEDTIRVPGDKMPAIIAVDDNSLARKKRLAAGVPEAGTFHFEFNGAANAKLPSKSQPSGNDAPNPGNPGAKPTLDSNGFAPAVAY